jgi:hypothetical protein
LGQSIPPENQAIPLSDLGNKNRPLPDRNLGLYLLQIPTTEVKSGRAVLGANANKDGRLLGGYKA